MCDTFPKKKKKRKTEPNGRLHTHTHTHTRGFTGFFVSSFFFLRLPSVYTGRSAPGFTSGRYLVITITIIMIITIIVSIIINGSSSSFSSSDRLFLFGRRARWSPAISSNHLASPHTDDRSLSLSLSLSLSRNQLRRSNKQPITERAMAHRNGCRFVRRSVSI